MKLLVMLSLSFIVSCQPGKKGKLEFQTQTRQDQSTGQDTQSESVKFEQIANLFERYSCIDCHDWVETEEDLLSDNRVNIDAPAKSRLYRLLKNRRMPPDGPFLTRDEVDLVLKYIQGLQR